LILRAFDEEVFPVLYRDYDLKYMYYAMQSDPMLHGGITV
jgi:hypothetical protein